MTDSLTIHRDALRIERNWTQLCAARHPLIQTKTALDRVWQSRDFFQTTKLFFSFLFLLTLEVLKAPVEHVVDGSNFTSSKTYSIIQCWFFLSTNGSSTSLLGWSIFHSKFMIRDLIQGQRNRLFGFLKEAFSWFAHLSPVSLIGLRVFIIATFSTATYSSLTRPELPLLSYTVKTENTLQSIIFLKSSFKTSKKGLLSLKPTNSLDLPKTSNYPSVTCVTSEEPISFVFQLLSPLDPILKSVFFNADTSFLPNLEIEANFKNGLLPLSLASSNQSSLARGFDFLKSTSSPPISEHFWLSPCNLSPDLKLVQHRAFPVQAIPFSVFNLIVTSFVPPLLLFLSGFFLLNFLTNQYELEEEERESDFLTGAILSPQFNPRRVKDILGVEPLLPELTQIFKTFDSLRVNSIASSNSYLLVGPPGTGKTKLAQAIAGEARIPFIGVSASVFLSRSNEASKKLRELFALTRKCSPCVLFIDEIDAFGQARHGLISTEGSRLDLEAPILQETTHFDSFVKLQALTEFLVQLDGISSKEKVLVIAATNSLNLDPALTRPGRFNRFLNLGLPNFDLRKRILKFHSKDLGFGESVSWDWLGHATENLSGAALQTIVNESALKVISTGSDFHTLETLELGIARVTGCSSLSSLLGFSNIAIYQNPFLFLKKSYFQTAQTLVSLLLESSTKYFKLELSSSSTVPSSDLNYEQILLRGNHRSTLLSTYKTKLNRLLISSLSDSFFFSNFTTIERKRLLGWLSLNSTDFFDEATLLAKTLVQKWFVFSSIDSFSSTQFYLKKPKNFLFASKNLTNQFSDLSGLSLQSNQFDLFFFDENWQPFEKNNDQVKVQPDLYYSSIHSSRSKDLCLAKQEVWIRETLLEAQQGTAVTLGENDFLIHTLSSLLVNRQFIRAAELEFLLKIFYFSYLWNHFRSFYFLLVIYLEFLELE